jgi:RHS repeat-associated protein
VFEEGTFVPAARLTKAEKLSIVTNYMGTPEAMYREDGQAVWTCELNSYGKVRKFQGENKTECPFRYQGQYEDSETGLYYNRFRYYSPDEGMYILQDPIRLNGGINLYSYVHNMNGWVDVFGLAKANGGSARKHGGIGHDLAVKNRINDLKMDPQVDQGSIRKNQQQVDASGSSVGTNRPDIQYDRIDPSSGKIVHHNEEFDTLDSSSSHHQQVIPGNDLDARNTFWYIDDNGNLRTDSQGKGSFSCL